MTSVWYRNGGSDDSKIYNDVVSPRMWSSCRKIFRIIIVVSIFYLYFIFYFLFSLGRFSTRTPFFLSFIFVVFVGLFYAILGFYYFPILYYRSFLFVLFSLHALPRNKW